MGKNSNGRTGKTTSPSATLQEDPQQQIARVEIERLAYHFYEQRGGQNGSDTDDWLKAEAMLARKK